MHLYNEDCKADIQFSGSVNGAGPIEDLLTTPLDQVVAEHFPILDHMYRSVQFPLKCGAPAPPSPLETPSPEYASQQVQSVAYANEYGGYALEYPSNWEIEEGSIGNIVLRHPSGEFSDKVVFTPEQIGKGAGRTLLEWVEAYFSLGFEPGGNYTFTNLEPDDRSASPELVQVSNGNSKVWKFYVSHGDLIWFISTSSTNEDVLEAATKIAKSLAFSPDAPSTRSALLRQDNPGTILPTLDEFLQKRDDANLAADAATQLIQTGVEPIELISQMSPYAREEYERILSGSADFLAEAARQRVVDEANSKLPNESGRYVNTQEFHEEEQRYYDEYEADGGE